ncbi:MAG: hypothetical protein HY343_06025, partial [Lentisphaerae bacterium]|nr:hypothetical protein [Lentisphaerota bacterium]
VDFVYADTTSGDLQLIQACWSLRDELAAAREVRALKTAMRTLKVAKGLIVTWMDEANPCEEITMVPFWKWAEGEDVANG